MEKRDSIPSSTSRDDAVAFTDSHFESPLSLKYSDPILWRQVRSAAL